MRFDHPAPVPGPRSRRARTIVEWFGLMIPRQTVAQPIPDLGQIVPAPGQIALITGPSGAGKSSLLRAIRSSVVATAWIDLASVGTPPRPLVDCFGRRCSLKQALSLLARVGLSEAWTYLRTPEELSDGQRWRLKLAIAMWKAQSKKRSRDAPPILVADEFAALLDRVTAAVVAHALRRSIDAAAQPLRAIVATSHDDLIDALEPDVFVECDFGSCSITRRASSPATREQLNASTAATTRSTRGSRR